MGIHHSRLEASTSLRSLLHHNEGKLISLLYNKEWEKAIARLEKHPREARIPFVVHKQSVYPLHAACTLSEIPLGVVKALVQADPDGPTRFSFTTEKIPDRSPASRPRSKSLGDHLSLSSGDSENSSGNFEASFDEQGGGSSGQWLPLHVAVYYGVSVQVCEFLIQQHPAAVLYKNQKGMLPLHLAVTSCTTAASSRSVTNQNAVQVVKLLLEAFPESRYIPSSRGENMTAFELLVNSSTTNITAEENDQLLTLLNPQQSYTSNTNEIVRVCQGLEVDDNPMCSPPPKRSMSLRPRSNSITALSPMVSSKQNQPCSSPTKLVLAIQANEWDDVVKRLHKKPSEAQVWTLPSNNANEVSSVSLALTLDNDPPCHSLPIAMALRRKAPVPVIRALLQAYPKAAEMREYYGMLPLHTACQAGACLQVVEALQEAYDEAARIQDLSGMLPLHLACSSEACRIDVICFLLDAHPESLRVKDSKGFLAIDYVRHGKHPHQRLVEAEFERGLDYWTASSEVVLIDRMLHREWDAALERVKSYPQEASRWTKHPIHGKRRYALHYACKYKAPPALVQALLEACPEATLVPIDDYRLLPLHLACSHGAADDVVKLLLECNRETASIPDSLGLLPLHLAITEGASMLVVEALLEAYPKATRVPDKKGFLPHVYAESSHHPSSGHVMELLSTMSIHDDGSSNITRKNSANKHARDATAALLQTKRQKSDRSLQGAAKIAPITV